MEITEKRLKAAIYAAYPGIDTWEDQDAVDYAVIRMEEILAAVDAVTFSDENVDRAYPFVYSFLKRRGMLPRGKEVESLIGYVVSAFKGEYDVE